MMHNRENSMHRILCFSSCIFITISVVFTATAVSGQARSSIGTFDIEKVRKAASGPAAPLGVDTLAGPSAGAAQPAKKSEGLGWVAVRVILYLALIAAAIFMVIWAIKRVGLAGRSKIGGGSMDMLEALPVGQNKAIMLVRVRDSVYVLAQTPQNITLLDKLEGDRAVELITSAKGVSISQFKDVFNTFMGKMKAPF
jgi:flagellar biosynthetic protein FliO